MPIPRYEDKKRNRRYEIVLGCTKCGYAVVKDGHTAHWEDGPCKLNQRTGCSGTLVTKRVDYGLI